MASAMQPGSVIVDIAAERGGNCELTHPGETIVHQGISILGPLNLARPAPYHASQMYGANITAFLKLMVKKGELAALNRDDEIIRETLVTLRGRSGARASGGAAGSGRRAASRGRKITRWETYEFDLWVFMLAAFLGFQLIRGVSPLLHTPLMSLTNAISAIAVVGAILITGEKDASTLSRILGFSAVLLATFNVVSGYLITDRMLKMFKKREPDKK